MSLEFNHKIQTPRSFPAAHETFATEEKSGVKSVFINILDPYGHYTYEGYDVEEFKRQYRMVIELQDKGIRNNLQIEETEIRSTLVLQSLKNSL